MKLNNWEDILFHLEEHPHIPTYYGYPLIIHQSWKTEKVPEHWQVSQDQWISLHPSFIYILWTDEMNLKLVETFYPEYLDQFKNYPHNIQRADFSRLCYLQRYGGIYSDLDIAPLKNFLPLFNLGNKDVGLILDAGEFNCHIEDHLRHTGSFFSRLVGGIAKDYARYTNMLMISKRRSRFWEDVFLESRNQKVPKRYSSRHFSIMWTTGPFLIDRVARKSIYRSLIYKLNPKDVNPCTVCDPKPCTKDGAYVSMLQGSSWADTDSTIITWCCCHWRWIVLLVLLLLVLLIFFLYYRRSGKKTRST